MAYHVGALRGGYLGVDLFFVLSGFLITTLLLEEARLTGSISLRGFYVRRALRLLPALLLLLVVCGGTVGVLAWADGGVETLNRVMRPIVRNSVIVLFYAANWAMVAGVGLYVLGHAWSLSIEEQFYLVWPPCLVGLLRLAPAGRGALMFVAGLTAASIAWRALLLATGASTARLFLGLDTRADALLLGVLAGMIAAWDRLPRSPRAVGTLRLAAVGSTALFVLLFPTADWRSTTMLAWGSSAAAAAAAVMLIHVVSVPHGLLCRALEWRPLVGVGKISYGLYLWHFPVFYACSALSIDGSRSRPGPALLGIAASFAMAGASFYFLERPLLRLKERFSPLHSRCS